MILTTYYPGGIMPDAPAQNAAEQWDSDAGTYTNWDPLGNVLTARPLTDEEITAVNSAAISSSFTGNQQVITSRAWAAVAANNAYLAIPSPSSTQVAAQVAILTRECTGLIRLLLGTFETLADT